MSGARVTVVKTRPPHAGNPQYSGPNCHITPNIGWATQAARRRLIDIAANNVKAFITGNPTNVVNKDQLP